jgi:catechol 2,3-dioxygenase-like lactoylglutathione lyase family enzyme
MAPQNQGRLFDHVQLSVKDAGKSKRFYRAALAALGLEPDDESGGSFGQGQLYLAEGEPGSRVHLAFVAEDAAQVRRFHAAGLDAGGRDNGGPGERPDYSPGYYAAFLFDPDGNNVEAVFYAKK